MSDASQPHHATNPPGSHYQPALSVVLIIVVLFVVAAFLMLRYVNPASSTSTSTTLPASGTTTTVRHHTVAKSTVRVQVANGTKVPNLARTYSEELLTQGWNCLPGVNALAGFTGSHLKATVVYFNPGFKWAAIQIANKIHVSLHSIQSLNGLRPVPGASSDDVIVILGHNSANKS
jgi:LytR cell envelope-related transcriptional attenuator